MVGDVLQMEAKLRVLVHSWIENYKNGEGSIKPI